MRKSQEARDVRIAVEFRQGYGDPDVWFVTAIDWSSNRLLEKAKAHSERDAGRSEAAMEARWLRAHPAHEWSAILAKAKPASPECSRCHGHTLERGATYLGDKLFCAACMAAGAAEEEKERIHAREADRQRADERRRTKEHAEYDRAAKAAQTGFHWRNGWYWRRLDDGVVSVCRVESAPSHLGIEKWVRESLEIPATEWASIVAFVSANRETGDSWQRALDFHGAVETPREPT